MPIYVFRCRDCGAEYESLAKRMGETVPCPECGSKEPERLIAVPSTVRRAMQTPNGRDSGCEAGGTAGFR